MRRAGPSALRRIRVLCLVPYPTLGASNRLRIEQYTAPLHKAGIDLEVSPFLAGAEYAVLYQPGRTFTKAFAVARGLGRRVRDLARASRYDLVLVHREASPVGPPLVERILGMLGVPYVYDFDDAIFVLPPYGANRRWGWLRPPGRVAESVRRARLVVTQNEYLAEWARRHNDRVAVIPTPVDTDLHRPAEIQVRLPLVIGWVGSPTTAPYLHAIDGALERVARTHEVVVRIVGGDYTNSAVRVDARQYSLEDEPREVAGFDVGVLPEPDDAWTRGKGAFKALLYMASAVPVVASRVGVNSEVIGDAGYCVESEDEWVMALERLLGDSALRRDLGARGRARVEQRYSVRATCPKLVAALREAAGESRSRRDQR